ncbi:hypothetical protein BV22DRAFT_600090 [Leucogyrophana mollusca]|uniref:Uncharacterized protein n=1 Tax=Leucogyrophana mollusca TaxID=85980 RepID=A0ACB8BD08_9AGAM|nr:hypothetical protein BV22DRAFT_600090 [Leucogyrophana mollusca]
MSIFDIDFHNLRDVRAHVEKEMEREAANPPAATTDDGKDRGAFPTERFPSPLPDGLWSIRPEHNPKNDAPAPTPAHAPATLSPPLMPLTFPPPPPLREDDPTWLAKMAADVQRQRAHLHTALAHARAEATAALVEATLVQTELQEEGRAMQRFLAKVSVVAGKRFVEKLVKEVEREMKGVGSDVEGREGEDEGAEDEDDSQGDGEDDAPEDDDDGDSDGSDDDDNDEGLYVPHGTKAPNPPNTSTNDNDSDSGSQAQHPNMYVITSCPANKKITITTYCMILTCDFFFSHSHHVPRAPLRLFGGNEPRGGAVPHPLLQQPLRNDERPDAGPSNSNGAGKSAHNAPGPAEQSAAGPSNHNAAGSSTLDAERPSNTNGAEPSNDHAAGPSNRHIPGPSNRRLPGVFRRNERVMRCEDDFNRDSSSSSSSDGENTQPMRNAPPPQELNGWPQGPSSNFYGQPIFQPHYFARDLAQPYGAAMREQAAVMSPYR